MIIDARVPSVPFFVYIITVQNTNTINHSSSLAYVKFDYDRTLLSRLVALSIAGVCRRVIKDVYNVLFLLKIWC